MLKKIGKLLLREKVEIDCVSHDLATGWIEAQAVAAAELHGLKGWTTRVMAV